MKVDELLEAAQQLEKLKQEHAGCTIPALETLVAYASLDEKEKKREVPPAITNSVTDDDTVFAWCPCSLRCTSPVDTCSTALPGPGRGIMNGKWPSTSLPTTPRQQRSPKAALAPTLKVMGAIRAEVTAPGIKQTEPVTFRIGEVVRHRKFEHRGVVLGWDIRPLGDANAIASRWEGVVGLPSEASRSPHLPMKTWRHS